MNISVIYDCVRYLQKEKKNRKVFNYRDGREMDMFVMCCEMKIKFNCGEKEKSAKPRKSCAVEGSER